MKNGPGEPRTNMNPNTSMGTMQGHSMCDCGMGNMGMAGMIGMIGMGLLIAAVIAVLIAATIYLIRRSRANLTPPR